MTAIALKNKLLSHHLKNAKKFSQMLLVKQEEDKKEISHELHDEIAQILTAVNFQLAILSKEVPSVGKKFKNVISDTQRLIENSVSTLHHFARELRPIIIDDLGLVAALRSYISEFQNKIKIPVTLKIETDLTQLCDFNKIVIFRIVQEALSNIAKHSKALNVSIKIKSLKDSIAMEIHDNGVSFKVKNQGVGLLGMSERIKMAKGTLNITSSKELGTLLKVKIPFKRKSQ